MRFPLTLTRRVMMKKLKLAMLPGIQGNTLEIHQGKMQGSSNTKRTELVSCVLVQTLQSCRCKFSPSEHKLEPSCDPALSPSRLGSS